MKTFHSAPQPNCKFNVDANTGHAFGILLAAVGALRPTGLRRQLTSSLGIAMKRSSIRWGSVLGLLVCLILFAGGLLPFFHGHGNIKSALTASFFGFCSCYYVYKLRGQSPKTFASVTRTSNVQVSFTDSSIVATYEGGERRTVAWNELSKVGITTTDEGPFMQDVFWGLHAGERVAVAYPQDAIGARELLHAMQERLLSFNNHAVIEAMGAATNAHFVVWERTNA